MPFFSACRPFTTLIPPPYDWEQEVVRNAADKLGLLAKVIDVDKPRRLLQSWLLRTSAEQLAWVIDKHAMPYLERYTNLKAVLDDVVMRNAEVARKSRDKTAVYFGLCEAALLRWRLGDLAGAEADLDGADLSFTRIVFPSLIPWWLPKDWFTEELDPEVEQFADATYAEQRAFVRELRTFVRHHDPTKHVVPVPLWPGLGDITWTWCAGTWRKRSLKMPWKEPTLLVAIHDEDVVGIIVRPGNGRFRDRMGRTWTDVLRRRCGPRRRRRGRRSRRVGAQRHRHCHGPRRVASAPRAFVDRRSGRGAHGVLPSPWHRATQGLNCRGAGTTDIEWHIRGLRSLYAPANAYLPLNVGVGLVLALPRP